ncbi:MAG: hypothetical protein ACLP3C_07865, partial [Mycobacterium sp.]|uniref:hypothetical protein n=1 Tax=Mycobacterium sp. TaxID=1785 RepID=UPI003F94524E
MSEPNLLDEDARLRALLAWREELVAAGVVGASTFKEAHVRLVHRSGCTDVEQIRVMLPGVVAQHAEEIARVLAAMNGSDGQPSPCPAQGHSPPDTFAPFALGDQTKTPEPVRLRRGEGGALIVSWPDYQAPFVVYRVVSDEQHPPYSPDLAHLVAATAETVATDQRDSTSAVRHYQVWVNAGNSRADALAAQPVLHAAGVLVATVCDMAVQEDSGRVIGRWNVFPGVRAVHVERVPIEESASGGPQYRILAGSDNLAGFVDASAERGRRYLYRARCEVVVDGLARLSGMAESEVEVSAVLAQVTDLAMTMHRTHPATFDLSWTPPPSGRVAIFRTAEPPAVDAAAAELPEAALDQAGLKPGLRLNYPISERRDTQGRLQAVMADVPWPGGWSRAYFTPVTLLGGRARAGSTTTAVRTGPVRDIQLTEYCSKQVVMFTWPEGAAAVAAYITPKNYDPRAGLTGRSYDITAEDYARYGGMQFTGQLPVGGCSLHLAPVAFSGGRRVLGEITSVTYDGLLRIWYAVHLIRDSDNRPRTAALKAKAEFDVTGSPPFVLVHNPDR